MKSLLQIGSARADGGVGHSRLGGAERVRDGPRMGRARGRARRRQGQASIPPPTRLQDPHHVEAKPSLIARARSADLVVATGAELEIGWLPLVLQQAGNPKVQPGQPGYFEAAPFVTLLDKPARLDRAEGDVHAAGDPHIQTDPRNIARVAAPLSAQLAAARSGERRVLPGAVQVVQRAVDRGDRALGERRRRRSRASPVLVQHKAFTYLIAGSA